MALNFPNDPATGDTYTPTGGNTYKYDGVKWVLAKTPKRTAANIRVGDTGISIADPGSGNIVIAADNVNVAYWTLSGLFATDTLFNFIDSTDPTKRVQFELTNVAPGTTRSLIFPDSPGQFVSATASVTLSNKTLDNTNTIAIKDANLAIVDEGDITKKVRLQLSELTTNQTKTLSAPNSNDTILLLEPAQTISNIVFANTSTITIHDANLTLQDNVDTTKQAKFESSGLTTNETKTFSLPDVNVTLVGANLVQTLTSKIVTIQDSTLSIVDNGDATKIAKFESNLISAGNTRTFTFPDSNIILVGTNIAQTISNKAFDNTSSFTINAANLTLQDNVDLTRLAKFDVSTISTGTTKTFSFADANMILVGANLAQTLTNKTITIQDSNLSIVDNNDPTKIAKFEASGITAGTTKTFTFPDANTILVGVGLTQTLTNKTIDNTSSIAVKDDSFTVQDNVDPTKQIKFEASSITAGTTKTITFPDANTTVIGTDSAQTLTNKNVVIQDSNLNIIDNGDGSKIAKFEVSGISTGTTQTFTFPDASITLVGANISQTLSNKTVSNTNTITVHDANLTLQDNSDATKQAKFELSGLTTSETKTFTLPDGNTALVGTTATQTLTNKTVTILDSNLTIIDNSDATKQAKFEVSSISTGTTRTFTLPDGNTTLVGTDAALTLSNKTIDSTNAITIYDANLTLQDNADTTKQAKFEVSSISTGTTKTFTLPDANTTLLGANATETLTGKTITIQDSNLSIVDNADTTKIAQFEVSGISTGTTRTFTFPDANTTLVGTNISQTLSNKTVDNTNTVTVLDNNLTLQDNLNATKQAKFELSGLTTGETKTFTLPDGSTTLVGSNTTQTLTNKTVNVVNENLSIVDNIDSTKIAKFEISGISSNNTRTFAFPDGNGTLVGIDSTQTLSNLIFANTSVITLYDANLTLRDNVDPTKQAKFELSSISTATTRTFTLPDGTTTLVGLDTVQTLTNKTVNIVNGNFSVVDNGDPTKIAKFEISGISTNTTRTFAFPDANTTLVGLTLSQTLSNKTIDNTTNLTVHDSKFTIQDNVDATKQAKFELSSLTTGQTKTFTLPDGNTTLVGANATSTLTNKTIPIQDANLSIVDNVDTTKIAKFESNGISAGTTRTFTLPDGNTTLVGITGTQTLSNLTFANTSVMTVYDDNFMLRDNSDSTKQAKFELSEISENTTKTFTFPDADTSLVGNSATQTLTNKTITIQDANLSIVDNANTTRVAKFEVSGISTATTRTFTLPDGTTTLVGLANPSPNLSNLVFANTSNITVLDSNLTLQDNVDATKQAKFELSSITGSTTRTFTFPDANTTLVGANSAQALTNKNITILDSNLSITNATKTAKFEVSGISAGTTQTFTFPDANTTLVGIDATQTFSNVVSTVNVGVSTFVIADANLFLQNSTDTTKQAKFQASSIANSTTRTFTLPDGSTTLVGTDLVQTLSNKTIGNATAALSTITITSSNLTLQDNVTNTKQAKFSVSISTTNTTRTFTFPNADTTLVGTNFVQTLSNKTIGNATAALSTITIKDSNLTLQDNVDTTKQARFETNAIITGTTATFTLPNADATFAGTDTTQTLNNKTFGSPTLTGTTNVAENVITKLQLKDHSINVEALGTLTGTGTTNVNIANASYFTVTMTSNTRTFAFLNPPTTTYGATFFMEITNGGLATITWPVATKWVAGQAPALTGSGVDVLSFTTNNAGTKYVGAYSIKDSK